MPLTPTLISSRSLPPSAPSASHRISPLPPQTLSPILAIAQVPSFLRTSGPQPSQPHPQSRARRPLSEAADGRFMLFAIYLNLRAYPGTPRLLHSRQAWQAGPYPHAMHAGMRARVVVNGPIALFELSWDVEACLAGLLEGRGEEVEALDQTKQPFPTRKESKKAFVLTAVNFSVLSCPFSISIQYST